MVEPGGSRLNRRRFLELLAASGVSSVVAGFELSHFLSWLQRKPRWSFPTPEHPVSTLEPGALGDTFFTYGNWQSLMRFNHRLVAYKRRSI